MYARPFRGRWHFRACVFWPPIPRLRTASPRCSSGKPDRLLEKLAVEPTDFPRIRNEGFVSLLGEFGLNLHGLVERAYAGELFNVGLGVFKRLSGVIAIGGSNRLEADRGRVRRNRRC